MYLEYVFMLLGIDLSLCSTMTGWDAQRCNLKRPNVGGGGVRISWWLC